MKTISVIVPCYNEKESVGLFFTELEKALSKISDLDFECIFINDGSYDGTLDEIKALAVKDKRVKYISFSRNFGKEAAMYAGLERCAGEIAAVMDVDLQDPPSLLPSMLKELENGYDCVATRRSNRKGEPLMRSFFARRFYGLINRISKVKMVDGARDFRVMTRQMVNAVLKLSERNRFSKGLFSWVGFNTKWIGYENIKRAAGKTKWSFRKLLVYSIDGIVDFSTAPLVFASLVGFLCFFLSIALALFYSIKALVFGDPVDGFPTLICIILMIGGLQLFCIGILGQYLAKTYTETKNRPIYIEKESNL